MSIIALFIAIICIIIYCAILYYRKLYPLIQAGKVMAGPKPSPIVGNGLYFLRWKYDEFLDSLDLLMTNYSSPFRVWMGHKLFVFVYEPDHIKVILQSSSCLNKSIIYNPVKPYAKTGLIMSKVPTWNMHRKILSPSFKTSILRSFQQVFIERSLIFVNTLQVRDAEFSPLYYLQNFTLDSIYGTMLGMSGTALNYLSRKNNQVIKASERFSEIVYYRMRNFLLFYDIIFNFTPLRRQQKKDVDLGRSIVEEAIEYRERVRRNVNPETEHTNLNKAGRKIFTDILLDALNDKKFTRDDVHYEYNTMTIAGSDTTATQLDFIMFMLANFPDVQEKVYEELFQIYGAQDPQIAPVEFDDLQHLNYLDCVIKETLRLFPVVPLIARQSTTDIKIGDYILPKDVEIVISIFQLHRNEKYWSNALTFDPERFSEKNKINIRPYTFIPFSNGLRNCIGSKYAMTSMKTLLANLIRTSILSVKKRVEIHEIKLKTRALLAPVEPFKIIIKKRN